MVMAKEICQGRYRNNYGDGHIHFLVAVYSMQGHLNPARCLARRLAGIGGATVTFDPGARTAWHTHPLGPAGDNSRHILPLLPRPRGDDQLPCRRHGMRG